MSKTKFYAGTTVVKVVWYLESCSLPKLRWARLRVFDNGTADASFAENSTLYGFDKEEYAGYFLGEDEYERFDLMDQEDEKDYGIKLSSILPPVLVDHWSQRFKYIGTY